MNKKNKISVLLYILLLTLSLARNLQAYYYNLNFLETNKDTYYYDEFMKINASWELYYNSNQEISYMQIQIFDTFDNLLWNSTKYYQIGIIEKNWTIEIQNLNYVYKNNSNTLFIKIYNYFKNLNLDNPRFITLKSISINILKRNITCELTGFKNPIKYGESLSLIIKFFCLENNNDLSNHSIEFKIISNNNIIYRNYFTTNQTGNIILYLSSTNHLALGQNSLIFNVSNNKFFKNTIFVYKLNVEKFQVLADLRGVKNNITINENIKFEIFYYYINQTIYPLVNSTINLSIFSNKILKYENHFITNNSGILKLNISYNYSEIEENQNILQIKLHFNGSKYLQNLSLYLNLELIRIQNRKSYFNNYIFLISLSISSIIIFLFFIYKIKKSKNKQIKDLGFKV